jgi:hypothetical protein
LNKGLQPLVQIYFYFLKPSLVTPLRIFIIIIVAFLIYSCSKEEKTEQPVQKKVNTEAENSSDTNLTLEEKFSSSLLSDFLNDSEDGELAEFLETEIYKMGASFKGASLLEISPSVWFLLLEKDGVTKNYLLQKFVNFKTNEYYFLLKETQLNITDIITSGKVKTSSASENSEP